jgi:hypothetical protein
MYRRRVVRLVSFAVGRGGGEAGRDGGVVHGVVEALRLHRPHPQLPRLVLRQHAEPPRALRVLLLRLGGLRVDVVWLVGPPQQRRPPLGAARPVGARPHRARPDRWRRRRRADGEGHPGWHRHFFASVPRFFDGVICEWAGMDVSCSAKAEIIKAGDGSGGRGKRVDKAGDGKEGRPTQRASRGALFRPGRRFYGGRSGPDYVLLYSHIKNLHEKIY